MGEIPKKIHYCWFGGAKKPEIVLKCIASWKKYMPNYEIIEWNEDNYDVNKAVFMKQAYEQRKWAFVSDYARFDILNEHGGIYFDTDVELIRSIPDDILQHRAFTGFEQAGQVSPGLIYGTERMFLITQQIIEEYQKMKFVVDGKIIYKTVNMVTTEILERYAKLKKNEFQVVEGLAIYPSQYFCGYDQDVREYDIRSETISVHHYAGTWKTKTLKKRLQELIKKVFGVEVYREVLKIKRKIWGVHNK